MSYQLMQYLLAHAENVIIILGSYSVLMTSLATIILLMESSESGFQDKQGYHSYQDAYEKTKNGLEAAEQQIKILEKTHEDMFDLGYKEGNLTAIKAIGDEMIKDHIKNIEKLEELPAKEKMGHKSKQIRSKRIHKVGLKVVDMNVLSDFPESEVEDGK